MSTLPPGIQAFEALCPVVPTLPTQVLCVLREALVKSENNGVLKSCKCLQEEDCDDWSMCNPCEIVRSVRQLLDMTIESREQNNDYG